MRIGVSVKMRANGYDRFGKEKYSKIKSHGFDCVDFDMCNTDHALYQLSEQEFVNQLNEERELSQKAGVTIWQTHGPWRVPQDFTEADRRERMEKMAKSIRATAILGCKNWVIHPVMPYDAYDIITGDEEGTWEINVAFFTELLKVAKEYDVTICLENTPFVDFSLGSPEQILKLVRHFNDSHIKMCLDTGHVAVFPGLSVGESIRQAADEIKVLHVHDNGGDFDRHLPPYEGIIDWQDFSSALKEIGFDGVISLEIVPNESLPTDEFESQSRKLAEIARKLAI